MEGCLDIEGEVLGSMLLGAIEGITEAVRDGAADKDGKLDFEGFPLGLIYNDGDIDCAIIGAVLGLFDIEGALDKVCSNVGWLDADGGFDLDAW